jgi:HK97 family phage major capsid protein
LLEDSAFQLAATLGDLQGEAIGRIQADHFTTGSGAGKPTGIITACLANSATQAAASASAIAFDDIINLEHAVDPAYRPGAIFMCHDTILASIRKLKDGQGRYLWSSGTAVGAPDTINGYRVVNNQSMDSSISSGQESVLFGDVSKYKIRDAGDIRMVRLNERFADSDQVGFIAFLRSDGNLLNAGVAPVKVLQH